MTEAEVVVNPMVEYVNSLRTQERGANPSYVYENRKPFLDRLRAGASWFPNDDCAASTTFDGRVAADLIVTRTRS